MHSRYTRSKKAALSSSNLYIIQMLPLDYMCGIQLTTVFLMLLVDFQLVLPNIVWQLLFYFMSVQK